MNFHSASPLAGLGRILRTLAFMSGAAGAGAATIYVAPNGDDAGNGSRDHPFATLAAAQGHVRHLLRRGIEPIEIIVRGGTYYLAKPLVFTADDSGATGAPVTYRAAPGEEVVLSGGQSLRLTWKPWHDGVMVADTPAGFSTDQLFINGVKQHLARYPNFDPQVAILGGHAADAIAPARTAHWAAPVGGYVHGLDENLWGSYHYRITGKNPDGSLALDGGWQTNRLVGLHREYRFVENIFEELDAPGEWFQDHAEGKLYLIPAAGVDLAHAPVESVRLRELVAFRGTEQQPVHHVALEGFTFRHAARTFMDTKEPLLRSDWTVYRGGAIFFSGAEDCALRQCRIEQVGGNAVFVSGYNRRVAVRECLIDAAGASGVLFVGLPSAVRNPLFNYAQHQAARTLDLQPGPQTNDYPMDCLVEDCVIRRIGRDEKQSAGVQIAMARRISVVHCSIYEVPRAGINIGDGNWGGHLIDGCDVFDTVLETGDHGSFNAWGRDRYWRAEGVSAEQLRSLARLDAMEPNIIRRSRWRCDNGWDIDLDDGASNYEIYENVLLHGGLKLREGFFRDVFNNIIVNNTLHPHVWFKESGDVFAHNIVMTRYRPALMPAGRWGEKLDHNLFFARDSDRTAFVVHGCDEHSLAGDPLFVDPAQGDFRVRDGSPALKVGLINFPMDQFGVSSQFLRALARTPAIPRLRSADELEAPPIFQWQGAILRTLGPGEFSAVGVPEGAKGLLLTHVSAGSKAAQAGLRTGDFIERVGNDAVNSPTGFGRSLMRVPTDQTVTVHLRREQAEITVQLAPPFGMPEKQR